MLGRVLELEKKLVICEKNTIFSGVFALNTQPGFFHLISKRSHHRLASLNYIKTRNFNLNFIFLLDSNVFATNGLNSHTKKTSLFDENRNDIFSNRRYLSAEKSLNRKINKVMSANRGEIAVRVFRTAKQYGMKSVAVYSVEDAKQSHRIKADEAYLVTPPSNLTETDSKSTNSALASYLNIEEIVKIAKKNNVDAIHPGYGFLSERADFAEACLQAGIKFLGPSPNVIKLMGDKMAARQLAESCNVPIIPGTDQPIQTLSQVEDFVNKYDFPIMLKAAYGGGGRGMRIVRNKDELKNLYQSATSEAEKAFGNGALFIEKYIESPRHIEVQILADSFGNVVHLFDRDCSVQRRHQKVIEIAPAPNLDETLRQKILSMAVLLAKKSGYQSAGTVEFLVDAKNQPYFIEVNSRLQVEHTVTEEITNIDIVKAQIDIAEGFSLAELGITQESLKINRSSIQARVTTEDSQNNFIPDYGKIQYFQAGEGPGIRLDGACGFTGAVITPHYDSLLVKVISSGKDHLEATDRLVRSLEETRISGVKTNIPFILNVLKDDSFKSGFCTTSFIDQNSHVVVPKYSETQAAEQDLQKVLKYVSSVHVNGPETVLATGMRSADIIPTVPQSTKKGQMRGFRNILKEEGIDSFLKSIKSSKALLLTDTTLRDAHQSLLATRMRTYDMNRIAPFITSDMSKLFSLECWGGATYDVAMRFLYECPWDRLHQLRELIPNIPFQMLLRGANAVGYKNYPDNVVDEFARLSVASGMDIFRIFDALNYLPNIQVAMDSVNKAGGLVEAAISYSGDVSNPRKTKYTIEYYMDLARKLVSSGTHILGIKDMAGVLKPQAAKYLFTELRREFPDIPMHLHTHDTAGTGIATYIEAAKAGANIVDVACDSMSGMTSQPSMGAIVAALQNTDLDTEFDFDTISDYSSYFEQARQLYAPFECTATMKSGNADVYKNEIPGGQYTNLQFQAFSLGLGAQFENVKKRYIEANDLLGDIIKVTPTSKVVGDLAQFMVQNNYNKTDILEKADQLDFPQSIVEFMKGDLGYPYQGYPEPLRSKILKNVEPIDTRPGSLLSPLDFKQIKAKLLEKYADSNYKITDHDVMSAALYPAVFDTLMSKKQFGPIDKLPTNIFLCGPKLGQEFEFELYPGRLVKIKLISVTELNRHENTKDVILEVDGHLEVITVKDKEANKNVKAIPKADKSNPLHLGAPMPGSVVDVKVKVGDKVAKGDPLVLLSAMKMETIVSATNNGIVDEIFVEKGGSIQAGDLLIKFK